MKQETIGWQWHQLDNMQIICISQQTQITTPAPHHSVKALQAISLLCLYHLVECETFPQFTSRPQEKTVPENTKIMASRILKIMATEFLPEFIKQATYFFGSRPRGILNQQWKSWHGCIHGPYLQLVVHSSKPNAYDI